ncbi:hypothetical protein [Clostridium hydrogenum]|nr:hypothetical protein [Clostridium hydrogenum]
MKKKDDDEIKVVIVNPERIPIAEERLIKFLYDEYIREIDLMKQEQQT